jgi:hypothetical protein
MQMDPPSTAAPEAAEAAEERWTMATGGHERRPRSGSPRQNATFAGGTHFLTVQSFLSANAIRATDSMREIDWCSSNNSPVCHLPNIHAPLLVSAMGGHNFIRDNEIHFEVAGSTDKDFIIVEGAQHVRRRARRASPSGAARTLSGTSMTTQRSGSGAGSLCHQQAPAREASP